MSNFSNAAASNCRRFLPRVALLLFLQLWPLLLILIGFSGWDLIQDWWHHAANFEAYKETIQS